MVKKLNIPLMNSHYASVLKLSNKEYNKNLIERISIKRKESIEAKKQKQEGEPVVIPKGPLSKAHVKHISEELEDHFRNNPEKIYNQTKRQNHFLNENPELREKMSEAMIYAWNRTKEGLSVKKYLSKFMKKYGGISEEELALKVTVPKEKITALELFWIKNPWARENFSIAVNKGWDYTKNYSPKIYFEAKNDENHITLNLIPTMINHKISSWAKENNFFIDENAHYGRILINKGKDYSNDEKAKQYSKKIEKTTVEYYKKHPKDADICATVLQLTLIDFENDLEKIDKTLPDFIRNNPELLENFKQLLSSLFHKTQIYKKSGEFNKNPIENIEFKTLIGIFTNIAEILAITPEGCKVAEYLNNKLDKIYNLFLTNNKTKINKIVTG